MFTGNRRHDDIEDLNTSSGSKALFIFLHRVGDQSHDDVEDLKREQRLKNFLFFFTKSEIKVTTTSRT